MLLRALVFGADALDFGADAPALLFQFSFCHCASVMTSGGWP